MSLFGSLFSGVSGLSAQSRAMGMISDNIANVNTTAYKGTQAQFANLVTGDSSARTYNPGGVRAFASRTVASQGLIQSTASPTDAAISGGGFFVVSGQPDSSGERVYSRAGAFTPDRLGNLRTASGYYLQGWALDANQQVADMNTLTTVNIRAVDGIAAATTKLTVREANLDAEQAAYTSLPAYAAGDLTAYAASGGASGVEPHFSRETAVFDSQGRRRDLTISFLREGAPGTWRVEVHADPATVDAATHPNGLVASGTVTFDGTGKLGSVSLTPLSAGATADEVGIIWEAGSGVSPSSIAVDLGTVGESDGLAQLATSTRVESVAQNGAEVGKLNGVSIDEAGYVIGSFTNGQERRLYQLPIATFANPGSLGARSGNVFAQTDASGDANLRAAGVGGAGTVAPAALEAANVDLADEFTRMIVTQRAYSANARVISTTDEMLDELIRLRR